MKKHSVMLIVITIAQKIRPLLEKLLPFSLLRKIKKTMIDSSMKKLKEEPQFLPFERHAYQDGVNLIGYIQGEVGLGESCRLVAQGLQAAQIPFTVYNYEKVSRVRYNDISWTHKITNTTPYNVNIIHIHPNELPLAYFRMGRNLWDRRYNIAFWLWEIEAFPKEWRDAFILVDEIWTPSEFASASIRAVTDKPVYTMPYPFLPIAPCSYQRDKFDLPNDKVLFLFMCDCLSVVERKNPMGVISAYKLAFSKENKDVGLVVKINNPRPNDIQTIKQELDGYPNIFLLSEIMDKAEVNALIACADVYVSLHRAEGFGLVMAEAMLLGTPVIATNWSSNTEFMNSEVACMVDCTMVQITQDAGPYKAGNRWAEPSLPHAAEYMKNLSASEELRNQIAEKAKAHIESRFAPEKAAALIQKRLREIYQEQETVVQES